MPCFPHRIMLLLALGAMLAACASAERLAERNNARCEARGLQPESKEFNACLTQLEGEQQARMERNRRDMMERPMDPPTGGPTGR
jgi:hypothetical protein